MAEDLGVVSLTRESFLLSGGQDPTGLGRIMQVDECGKVRVSERDIERIAQRVAALLRPTKQSRLCL
jgi:hypothetical protein